MIGATLGIGKASALLPGRRAPEPREDTAKLKDSAVGHIRRGPYSPAVSFRRLDTFFGCRLTP
jgi:hypothetical protein